MRNEVVEAGLDTISRYVKSRVEEMAIKAESKALLVYVVDNSSALISFASTYAQMKATGKVDANALMVDFLKSKGRSLADFGITVIDNETLSDIAAAFNLVMDISASAKYSSSGPIGVALTVGFLFNDVGAFLANFTPAQRAYYEFFLKQCDTRISIQPPPAMNLRLH